MDMSTRKLKAFSICATVEVGGATGIVRYQPAVLTVGITNRSVPKGWLKWEACADQARQGNFANAQARKVVNDIAQRSGMGAVEFATTEKFLTDWIARKEVTKAKGTTALYRYVIEQFSESLGDRAGTNLGNVRPLDIATFRDEQMKDGKSNGTTNMVIKTLRIPFNIARRQGFFPTRLTKTGRNYEAINV
jgi:hypothetical protein